MSPFFLPYQMISQQPELDWYWIDDDISARELAVNHIPQERCIQVSPKGAGALTETRRALEMLRKELEKIQVGS